MYNDQYYLNEQYYVEMWLAESVECLSNFFQYSKFISAPILLASYNDVMARKKTNKQQYLKVFILKNQSGWNGRDQPKSL